MLKKGMLVLVPVLAALSPMAYYSGPEWWSKAKASVFPAASGDVLDESAAPGPGAFSEVHDPSAFPGTEIPVEGAPVENLHEVFRFDVTPDWIVRRWPRVSAGLPYLELQGYRAPLVMEGGSLHVDGEGTVLTTEECLLNPNRNPGLTRADIEKALRDYLGAEKVVWLGRGLDPEVTSGHVDDVAFLVRPGTVAISWTDDESDHRYEIMAENLERLESARDARGRRFKIHRIPL
ncbi:MAG: agmatine deiminase family protein, partial [Planctomycetota bacterium]